MATQDLLLKVKGPRVKGNFKLDVLWALMKCNSSIVILFLENFR